MGPAPEDPTLAPWRELAERLAGYFAARPRGFLASEFALSSRSGEEFGRLRVHGLGDAQLEAGGTRAEIERTAGYRMLTGGVETLRAEPTRGMGALEVRCGSRTYEADFDAGDDGALPVALFLLYHTVALRRRVFLAGAGASNS